MANKTVKKSKYTQFGILRGIEDWDGDTLIGSVNGDEWKQLASDLDSHTADQLLAALREGK